MASAGDVAEVVAQMVAFSATLGAVDSADIYAEWALDSHSRSACASNTFVRAMAFYALHMVQSDVIAASGAIGPMQSKRIGKTSVSYTPYSMSQGSKAATQTEEDLQTTVWGRRYLAWRQQQTGARIVSGRVR